MYGPIGSHTMNFPTFAAAMLFIVGFAYITMNVNWKKELTDLINLFKGKEGI